ncbi:hypothetical protein JKP88DRAFT_280749 [Tribonema minus]|uniref:Uncharacterized protein n=1 Tax=Tribonema minus TaxID=303371 RepID=A0A835YXL1_9STRA|nr:hypothetical protein JKP88DRAFT_280749 [Tribonema minus]
MALRPLLHLVEPPHRALIVNKGLPERADPRTALIRAEELCARWYDLFPPRSTAPIRTARSYDLFPPRKDPRTAPIRAEELRALVRKFNLHHARHFWRNHPSKDDVVYALNRHIRHLKYLQASHESKRAGRGATATGLSAATLNLSAAAATLSPATAPPFGGSKGGKRGGHGGQHELDDPLGSLDSATAAAVLRQQYCSEVAGPTLSRSKSRPPPPLSTEHFQRGMIVLSRWGTGRTTGQPHQEDFLSTCSRDDDTDEEREGGDTGGGGEGGGGEDASQAPQKKLGAAGHGGRGEKEDEDDPASPRSPAAPALPAMDGSPAQPGSAAATGAAALRARIFDRAPSPPPPLPAPVDEAAERKCIFDRAPSPPPPAVPIDEAAERKRQSRLRAQQKCSVALLNMTLRDCTANAFLGEYQLLPPLLDLMRGAPGEGGGGGGRGGARVQGDLGVLTNCCAAVVNLLSEEDCKASRLPQGGAMPFHYPSFKPSFPFLMQPPLQPPNASRLLQGGAVPILKNVVAQCGTASRLLQGGAVPVLKDVASRLLQGGAVPILKDVVAQCGDERVRQCSAAALAALSAFAGAEEWLVQDGALGALSSLARMPNLYTSRLALAGLVNVALILTAGRADNTQRLVVSACRDLVVNVALILTAGRAGNTQPLVVRQISHLLQETDDSEIASFCAAAALNLTVLPNVRAYLDDQVVDIALTVLRSVTVVDIALTVLRSVTVEQRNGAGERSVTIAEEVPETGPEEASSVSTVPGTDPAAPHGRSAAEAEPTIVACAWTLYNLIPNKMCRFRMAGDGMVVELARLLRPSAAVTDAARRACTVVLAEIASAAVTDAARRVCTVVLAETTRYSDIIGVLLDDGIISAFATNLSSADAACVATCADGLSNLVCMPESHARSNFNSADAACVATCADGLSNLACMPENHARMLEGTVTTQLLAVLTRPAAAADDAERSPEHAAERYQQASDARRHVLRVLTSLACNPVALPALIEAGLANWHELPEAAVQVNWHESQEAAEQVSIILYNISCNPALRHSLAVPAAAATAAAAAAAAALPAAAAVEIRAGGPAQRRSRQPSYGAVPPTLRLLVGLVGKHRVPTVQGPCLGALQNLSTPPPSDDQPFTLGHSLLDAGVMDALAAAREKGAGASIGEHCASVLFNLTCSSKHCASVLFNLSCSSKLAQRMVEVGGVSLLTQLAHQHFMFEVHLVQRMVEVGGVSLLTQLAHQHHKGQATKRLCAAAFCNITVSAAHDEYLRKCRRV